MPRLYFEDVEIGAEQQSEAFVLTREAVLRFAREWDPLPFHLDDEAAAQSIFGGLTACAAHIFAIQSRLSCSLQGELVVLAGLGSEGLELRRPARPGDRLRLTRRFAGKRESRSNPGRGIVKIEHRLVNQHGEIVFYSLGSVMVARRDP